MWACLGANEPGKNITHYSIISKLLLDSGADVDSNNYKGESGLQLACFFGLDTIVELLIEKQADVNKSDKNGDSPSLIACLGANEPGKNT